MNIDQILDKAKWEPLTDEEKEQVHSDLVDKKGDLYALILILGRASAYEYRSEIEKYLRSPNDPMLAKIALQVLCDYWGLSSDYKLYLEEFVRGVTWDVDEDVRLVAISCAANLVISYNDLDLLECVYNVFTNEEDDETLRQAAYASLARSYGVPQADIPSPLSFDFSTDVDPLVLKWVKSKIS